MGEGDSGEICEGSPIGHGVGPLAFARGWAADEVGIVSRTLPLSASIFFLDELYVCEAGVVTRDGGCVTGSPMRSLMGEA